MRFHLPGRLPDLHCQNPPKTFGIFRKAFATFVAGEQAGLTCSSSHISFQFVESISRTQSRTKIIIKIISDNGNGHVH